MKKLLITLLLSMFILSGLGSAYFDIAKTFSGEQMLQSGAPWIADNQKLYFGNDKDAYIEFDADGTAAANFHGLSTLLEGAGVSIDSGEDLAFEGGDSKADFSAGSGVTKSTSGAVTLGPGAVTLSGTVWMPSAKTFNLAGAEFIGGLSTVNTFKVNKTSTLTGVTTIGITNQTSGYIRANTTLVSSTVKPFYWLKPASAHVGLTVTLPPAAEMDNSTLEFSIDTATSNGCLVTLDGSGSETINGATTKTASALYSSIRLKGDGLGWHILSNSLTWS